MRMIFVVSLLWLALCPHSTVPYCTLLRTRKEGGGWWVSVRVSWCAGIIIHTVCLGYSTIQMEWNGIKSEWMDGWMDGWMRSRPYTPPPYPVITAVSISYKYLFLKSPSSQSPNRGEGNKVSSFIYIIWINLFLTMRAWARS